MECKKITNANILFLNDREIIDLRIMMRNVKLKCKIHDITTRESEMSDRYMCDFATKILNATENIAEKCMWATIWENED